MNKALFLILFSSLFLVACEQEEDDKIYTAQICMNQADTGIEADACLAPLSGLNSTRAYVLRCAGDFIRAGITTPTIITAIQNIDDNDSNNTADPTLEFYQQFSFGYQDVDVVTAGTAVSNCTASGSKNLRLLALSAESATILRNLAFENVGGTGDITTWLNGSVDPATLSDAEVTAIGNNVLNMQASSCGEGGTFEDTEICDNMNNAIAAGAGDPNAIGEAFISQLQSAND